MSKIGGLGGRLLVTVVAPLIVGLLACAALLDSLRLPPAEAPGSDTDVFEVPGVVTDFPQTPRRMGESTYRVYWTPPSDNGSPIINYAIYAFTCDGVETGHLAYTGSGVPRIDFGPAAEDHDPPLVLEPGVSYRFTVSSQNALGWDEGIWNQNPMSPCSGLEIDNCLDPVFDWLELSMGSGDLPVCD